MVGGQAGHFCPARGFLLLGAWWLTTAGAKPHEWQKGAPVGRKILRAPADKKGRNPAGNRDTDPRGKPRERASAGKPAGRGRATPRASRQKGARPARNRSAPTGRGMTTPSDIGAGGWQEWETTGAPLVGGERSDQPPAGVRRARWARWEARSTATSTAYEQINRLYQTGDNRGAGTRRRDQTPHCTS